MEKRAKTWLSLTVILVAGTAAGFGSYRSWRHNTLFVSTENAYVKGPVVNVAAKVAGTLLTLTVTENQEVKAGQPLATLDPRDAAATAAKALGALEEAQAAQSFALAQIAQAQAQAKALASQLALATLEERRVRALVEREALPRQKHDQARTVQEVAAAQLEAARKQVVALQGALSVNLGKAAQCRAALEQARLLQSYCQIAAPCDGFVSRKLAEPGMVVGAGQPLLAVVPLGPDALWVEANFKETQLTRVRPGQRVSLRADSAADQEIEGVVDSIAPGTGSVFSLLPPENATGNWVKVVQRVPVRIRLKGSPEARRWLRLGLTMAVTIDTRG